MKRLLVLSALPLSALALAACTPTYAGHPMPSSGAMPSTGGGYGATAPSTPAMGSTSPMPMVGLRAVHSPGVVTDDMHLRAGMCHARSIVGEPAPDPACTPGAYDPAVTQATIKTTICMSGWTATVRPPVADTARWKHTAEAAYGDSLTFTGEYDHLVPLELGGANSTSNLWPEAGRIPNVKDKVEGRLRTEVCAGTLTLANAQAEIASNWTDAK